METSWTQELLNWISSHPGWAGVLIFTVSFVESLAVVGLAVPGIFILFGVGTMVGLGMLEMWPIWVGGSVGAFCGDILSFYAGHRYRAHLRDIWPFSRYPRLLMRGTEFFRRHGNKSVIAGRFIGPLRPVIPATAGMLGMTPARFTGVCVPASILWTPVYLLPGVLFGASLEVAAEYAGRLTLVLIVLVALLWLSLWALGTVYALFASYSARWLRRAIRWTRRHPVLGRITGPILDPSQPELLSVSMLGLLLVFALWSFGLLLFLAPFGPQPQALDLAILSWVQSLRNHIADPFMVAVSQLSRWWVLLPTSVATLLWLVGAQRLTAALHWLVAMAGGLLLQGLMSWTLRATPFLNDPGSEQIYVPSAPMTMTTVVLGFFSVMVARELRRRSRKWPYLAGGLLLTLLLIARIYLGLDWLSGALAGFILGLAWTAIVGIAYRQRAFKPFSGTMACSIFFGTLALTLGWQINERLEKDLAALQLPLPGITLAESAWWSEAWAELPRLRTQSRSVAAPAFNVQALITTERLQRDLEDDGWEAVETADWQWLVQTVNPEPSESSLPLIGKDYLDRREALLLRKDAGDAHRQWVLRLWDSGFRLQPGDRVLYIGQLSMDVLVQRFRVLSYWRSLPIAPEALGALAGELDDHQTRRPEPDLLIIRPAVPSGSGESTPAAHAGDHPGR